MKFKSLLFQCKFNSYSWYQMLRFRRFSFLPFNDKSHSFDNSLVQIINEVREERKYLDTIPNFENIIQKAAKYNLRGENNHIGRTMLAAYDMMHIGKRTIESDHQAYVLAWAAQMTDSYSKLISDVENNQEKEPENIFYTVCMDTVRNADFLRSFMYSMVEQTFQGTQWYADFLQLYNKVFFYRAIGQHLEQMSRSRKLRNSYEYINANEYEKLCHYKVSYPYFQFPLFLAMTLANKSLELRKNVERICSDMGMLYQIQEDFNNCFAADVMIGPGGTDIQEGKNTWLAVSAVQRLKPRQRIVFETCYGSDEPAHIERVMLLYEQLKLPQLFREREGALCESIMQQAETLEKSGIPCKLFEDLMNAIRNR